MTENLAKSKFGGAMSSEKMMALTSTMDNVLAWRMGEAHSKARDAAAGDYIDRGLALLRELNAAGFDVVSRAAVTPPAQGTDDLHEAAIAFLDRVKMEDWSLDWLIANAMAAVLASHPDTVAGLVAALEPFALEADNYDFGDGSGPDLRGSPDESSLNEANDLLVGQLRKARAALAAHRAGGAAG